MIRSLTDVGDLVHRFDLHVIAEHRRSLHSLHVMVALDRLCGLAEDPRVSLETPGFGMIPE